MHAESIDSPKKIFMFSTLDYLLHSQLKTVLETLYEQCTLNAGRTEPTFFNLVNFLRRLVLLFGVDLYHPLNADISIEDVSLLP